MNYTNINNGSLMLTESLEIDNKNNQEEINNTINNNITRRVLLIPFQGVAPSPLLKPQNFLI